MKILCVGDWSWSQYEDAFAKGLRENGHEVLALPLNHFFNGTMGRIQKVIPLPGVALLRINRAVIDAVSEKRPDLVLFWRPTHIFPKTVQKINKLGVCTVSYNNDDPFGPRTHGKVPWHHHLLWFWYLRCLRFFNKNFLYRRINCLEALDYGAKHAEVLMPYFMPWKDRPVELTMSERERFATDIVFVGHYEPDGRVKRLRALANAGMKIKLWGGGYWTRDVLGDLYDDLAPIGPAEGDNYAKALCGAKVCLAFLSKLNRDTYTRRCFEIPACGAVMLAERTPDLLRMFKEDEEACFFSSVDEMIEKARWLVDNDAIRNKIAEAGLRRVWSEGHDVGSRARQFLGLLNFFEGHQ